MFRKFPFARSSTILKNPNRFSISPGLQPQPPIQPPPGIPNLRIYQNRSTLDLLNMLLMNTVCTKDIFVDNCHHLYNYSQKIVGKTLTQAIVANTMGKIFTAGDSLKTVENFIASWPYKNVNIYVDYSNEAVPGQVITKEALDDNTRVFVETIRLAAKASDKSGIAIKPSAMCLPDVLLKTNSAELNVRSLFSSGFGNLTETLTAKQIMNKLTDMKIDLTFSDFQEFLTLFFNKQVVSEGELDQVKITKFDWLNNMHCYYVRNTQKNSNKILAQLANFEAKDLAELANLSERFDAIFSRAAHDKCTVLVDAEQSYIQVAIDFFTMQYSEIYNKEGMPIVLNTFQNYLKSTKDRVHFEHERCKALKLPFAAKLVRGAYMVAERRLAKELKYPDPIHDTIQDTHDCYNHNIRYLTSNWIPGSHLMVASHNEYSVNLGKSLVKENNITTDKGNVSFIQLLGLADNLTFTTAEEGFTQAKYVPFGPIPIMIPYLIRRAQESKQMLASASLQRSYVLTELSKRIKRS